MSRSASLALLLAALPAAAQERLPTVSEIVAGVRDTEVYLLGTVTTAADGALLFRLPEGILIPARPFDGSGIAETIVSGGCVGGMLCALHGHGALQWDGPALQVLIYSIESLGPPAELN